MGTEVAPVQDDPEGVADSRYRRIYDSHYHAVLAYCLRQAGSADAQDAAAEVFTCPDETQWNPGYVLNKLKINSSI